MDRMERIEKQRRELFLKRETKIRTIDQKVLAFYEKIRRWSKNSGVGPVFSGCMDGDMKLMILICRGYKGLGKEDYVTIGKPTWVGKEITYYQVGKRAFKF